MAKSAAYPGYTCTAGRHVSGGVVSRGDLRFRQRGTQGVIEGHSQAQMRCDNRRLCVVNWVRFSAVALCISITICAIELAVVPGYPGRSTRKAPIQSSQLSQTQ
eukprot:4074-Rhodomonas_salina.2